MSSPHADPLERLGEQFALTTPTERKRLLVITNPFATTVSERLKRLVVFALEGRYEVEAVDTQRRNHATELCREAASEGYDAVVSFGGDGTVNECANGLAGSRTPLTCLPGGATNVLCKMLGIPGDIVDATEHLLLTADRWKPDTIDLAQVNDRYFTFSAGLGVDAAVVKEVDARPHLKHRHGPWYFAYRAVHVAVRDYLWKPPRFEVTSGGVAVEGMTSIIQNGDPFTYFGNHPLHLCEGASLQSGTLSAVVLRRALVPDVATLAFRLLTPKVRMIDHKHVEQMPVADELTMRSDVPIPLEVDGDYIGDVSEAVFRVLPGGLRVVR
ncbi:MAG: diacylglycerol kinase family lipid kinase [Solirubrobacteraceae bacterium]|nr:diacylglycerol kinase family lipid kinase [Solirubrobacteraceae bacterium]